MQIKKFRKGKQEWEKMCVESGLLLRKLKTFIKTRFACKVIMFEECFEFKKNYPSMFMTNKIMTLQQQVPKPKVGLLYNNYFLLEPCRECICDELIKKALDLIKCLDYYW